MREVDRKIRQPFIARFRLFHDMHRLLVCLLAVVSYAYADTSVELLKTGLIDVHMSIRNNFEFRGEKLVPFVSTAFLFPLISGVPNYYHVTPHFRRLL